MLTVCKSNLLLPARHKGVMASKILKSPKPLPTTSYSTAANPKEFTPLTLGSFRNPKVFQHRPTSTLLFNYSILRSCSITPLVSIATALLNTLDRFKIAAPAHWIVKHTYFKHFVAGESLEESLATAAKLSKSGVNTILDYSIESADGNIDSVTDTLVEAIRLSAAQKFTPFSCFKITALTSPHLLMRITELLKYHEQNPSSPTPEFFGLLEAPNYPEFIQELIQKKKAENPVPGAIEPGAPHPQQLTAHELETWFLPLAKRMERLGDIADKVNQRVLIDAEHSWFQGAIHFVSRALAFRYNKTRPLIYDTCQMYLKSSLHRLESDLKYARSRNLVMGAKLVRGAYMDRETEWSNAHNSVNPVFDTIEQTHRSYDAGVKLMLEEVKRQTSAVVVATHNEDSLVKASQIMAAEGIAPDSDYVHFAQLYGMCDHLSLNLATSGHHICKYVPFGPVHEVMPYLLRRVEENKGFLASTRHEQKLMLHELKSRFFKKDTL